MGAPPVVLRLPPRSGEAALRGSVATNGAMQAMGPAARTFSLAKALATARRHSSAPPAAFSTDTVQEAASAEQQALSSSGLPLPWARGAAPPASAVVAMCAAVHGVSGLSLQGSSSSTLKLYNQDRAVIVLPRGTMDEEIMVAVMDGHGVAGHHVAGWLADTLPTLAVSTVAATCPDPAAPAAAASSSSSSSIKSLGSCDEAAGSPADCAQRAWEAVFAAVDERLMGSGLNVTDSGSTCTCCHVHGRQLTTAWVGDSRALLARRQGAGWQPIPLSADHDPARPDEQVRITLSGGRVQQLVHQPTGKPMGPARVWLRDADWPGLAMSRAFGDMACRGIGVIAAPEVTHRRLERDDGWLIVASDGVWGYMDNQQVVDLVGSCATAEEAVEKLVRTAERCWLAQSRGYTDDITAVVVKLNVE